MGNFNLSALASLSQPPTRLLSLPEQQIQQGVIAGQKSETAERNAQAGLIGQKTEEAQMENQQRQRFLDDLNKWSQAAKDNKFDPAATQAAALQNGVSPTNA